MNRLARISVSLRWQPDVQPVFADAIEIGLDCPGCRRNGRTVIFESFDTPGRCTPTNHVFAGRLVSKELAQPALTVTYTIAYFYEPFVDAKYPERWMHGGRQPGTPSWARAHFQVRCPACGNAESHTTQSNLVRPHDSLCRCGNLLYRDQAEPVLAWQDAL
jgi:ribosomal protein S27E